MAQPNTKIPTEKTVQRDFETGTVQPGPGLAPDKLPAEDMQGSGAAEEFQKSGSTGKKEAPATQPKKSSSGCCGCG